MYNCTYIVGPFSKKGVMLCPGGYEKRGMCFLQKQLPLFCFQVKLGKPDSQTVLSLDLFINTA